MKNVTMIKMQGCPYCASAKQAVAALQKENADYAKVKVDVIDENEQPELAAPYGKDYYYVPSLFVEGKKIYEAHPGDDDSAVRAGVEKAFQAALA